jgi:multicomponent Na+:H+ antiporter subunit D
MIHEVTHPAILVLIAAGLMGVLPRRIGHVLGVLGTGTAVVIAWTVPAGSYLDVTLFGTFDAVLYSVDDFSRLMGLIFGFIGAVAVVYSYASEAEGTQTAFALAYVGTSLGAVYAGDWLTLIFFWELMAVASTLLVWHYGGVAVRAGFRYAVLHGIGGSLLLAAIAWHFAEVGSVAFDAHPGIASGVPAALAAVGIGVNVGFVGLHAWLPDTYPRPHIAASVFLCVYTTKTGVYGMYRAFPNGHLWIAYMGGAMAVFGAFAALLQSDMRRLLSYHIQSQVGYMIAGVGLGGAAIGYGGSQYYYDALATAGAFGHIFNHILYKALLFMTVGVIIYRTGKESLDDLGGLGVHMPITAITFGIAALSIAGFPGFNGFVSKGMIIGAANKKELEALWYLLLLGGVGTFLSFIKLGYFAFIEGSYGGMVRDANRGQSVALVSVAGLCVLFGLVPDLLFELLPFQGQYEYTTYTIPHIGEGLALFAIGLIGFAILRGPLHHIGLVPDVDYAYNRVFFYGGRVLVVAATELYAAIDRAGIRLVRSAYWTGRNPAAATQAAAGWLPGGIRPEIGTDPDSESTGHPTRNEPSRLFLRAGIGTTILILSLVLTLLLLFAV